jgi:hypothetical protein
MWRRQKKHGTRMTNKRTKIRIGRRRWRKRIMRVGQDDGTNKKGIKWNATE